MAQKNCSCEICTPSTPLLMLENNGICFNVYRNTIVSQPKGYVPPYLRKQQKGESPFYKKYDSGTDDIYAYKGKKYGIAKYFEDSRIPNCGRIAVPNVEGHLALKKYKKSKRRVGFWCFSVPAMITVVALALLVIL